MKNIFLLLSLLIASITIHAQDCDDPLNCNNFLNFSLDDNGEGTITADMTLEGNFDPDCDYEISLMVGTTVLITGTNSLDVDCSYIGEYTLSIANDGGSCWGTINIEDILQVCSTDVGAGNLPLTLQSGNSTAVINNVDMNGNPLSKVFSWLYAIPEADILAGENLIEFPESTNSNPSGSVSTLDLVVMQKMFTDGVEFPLRAVLSDVDGSNYFGVNDLVTSRELILGIITEFPNSNHLYFPNNYKFSSSFDAFDDIPNFKEFKFNQDTLSDVSFTFSTYALADINSVTDVDSFATQTVSDRNFTQSILIKDQMVEAGDIVEVPVQLLDESQTFIGLQMGLKLDGATLLDVDHNYSGLELMSNTSDNSNLRFSLLNGEGSTTMEMSLNLEIQEAGWLSQIISLNSSFDQEMANFEENGQLDLVFLQTTNVEDVLLNNLSISPNPMMEFTNIEFASDKSIQIEVLNAQGQLIQKYNAVNGQLRLSRAAFPTAGMYFIQASINDKKIAKKLIVL